MIGNSLLLLLCYQCSQLLFIIQICTLNFSAILDNNGSFIHLLQRFIYLTDQYKIKITLKQTKFRKKQVKTYNGEIVLLSNQQVKKTDLCSNLVTRENIIRLVRDPRNYTYKSIFLSQRKATQDSFAPPFRPRNSQVQYLLRSR